MDVVGVQSNLPILASQTGNRVGVENILSQAEFNFLNLDGRFLIVLPAYSGGTRFSVP